MSLEDQINSRSCKDRAVGVVLLEQEWLKDKNSHQHLINILLKEKNIVVLEKLIPVFKVIPYSEEILLFVIENIKTLKLRPKVYDYLDCKHKFLNIQVLFDELSKKNPKYVENILLYIIHFYETFVYDIASDEQLEQLKATLCNSDPNVRRNAVELFKIFYSRNKTINLDSIKQILVDEIVENRKTVKKEKKPKKTDCVSHSHALSHSKDDQNNKNISENENISDEPMKNESTTDLSEVLPKDEQDSLIAALNDSNWKIRLEAVQKISENIRYAHHFVDELNKKLKDSNNQIFCITLSIFVETGLEVDRKILIQKLSDKKLQEKIKQSGLIIVSVEDFEGKKSPEIEKMLIEIAISQNNKNMKEQVARLETSARMDIRETAKKYRAFCENKKYESAQIETSKFDSKYTHKRIKETFTNKIPSEKAANIYNKTSLSNFKTQRTNNISQKDVAAFEISEPISKIEQTTVLDHFLEKYPLFMQKDFRKRLEKIDDVLHNLINEPDLLQFFFSLKEKNKMMNLKFLEIVAQLKNIDTILFCHIIIQIFTDPQIFIRFIDISSKLDEQKTLLFFIKFIYTHRKGKLFEKGIEAISKIQKEVIIHDDVFDPSLFIGKEKQILISLSKELQERLVKDIPTQDASNKTSGSTPIEESLIQQFESSVIIDDVNDSSSCGGPENESCFHKETEKPSNTEETKKQRISYEEKRQSGTNETKRRTTTKETNTQCASKETSRVQHLNRYKDGKNVEKYFTEDIQTLFDDYKVEASDFIVKYIYEEKKCLCGQNKDLECCLKVLMDFYISKRYALSAYEAECYVKLIKDENYFRMMEKIYPKSKILVLRSCDNHFKTHLQQSFRYREYNISPLRKKPKPVEEIIENEDIPIFPLVQSIPNNKNIAKFVVGESFDDSFDCLGETSLIPSKQPKDIKKTEDTKETMVLIKKTSEKRLSVNTLNGFLIKDLYHKKESAFITLLQRTTNEISSLFYIANSVINALIENFENFNSAKILLILSTNKDFLLELDFETMKMLHLRIIKDIQEHGGDILINLCLNAPVSSLLRVYLTILNDNKEIILKLIWRNSKRKFLNETSEILDVFDEFFFKEPSLDDLTFKIVQLHISEIVSQRGSSILEFPMSGQLRQIVTGMLERLSENK